MINKHGVKAVEENLPSWLSETSSMGSGDDITLLIAYFSRSEKLEEAEMDNDESVVEGVE